MGMNNPSGKKILFFMGGGIGDLLLEMDRLESLPDFLNRDQFEVLVASHAKNIEHLFEHLDYKFRFIYFNSQDQKKEVYQLLSDLNKQDDFEVIKIRDFFKSLSLTMSNYLDDRGGFVDHIKTYSSKLNIKNNSPIIGIHPFGSKFSNDFLVRCNNYPSKNIPSEIIKGIVDYIDTTFKNSHTYILGLKDEIDSLEIEPKDNLTLFTSSSLWESFSIVDNCDLLVGADSVMKSFSCMRKIPSIVFLGDYSDPTRDPRFITPYFDDGVLYPIYFDKRPDRGDLEVCQILIKTLLMGF